MPDHAASPDPAGWPDPWDEPDDSTSWDQTEGTGVRIRPDVLNAGPTGGRPTRATVTLLVVLAVVVAGAVLGWRLWPQPVEPMTLTELQGVYAGMVRSDGTNDAEQIPVDGRGEEPIRVQPTACTPLAQPAYPGMLDGAADGMTTYWTDGDTTQLTTYRFTDRAAADQAFGVLRAALASCGDHRVTLGDSGPVTLQVPAAAQESGAARGSGDELEQLTYLLVDRSGQSDDVLGRFAFRLVLFNNTVSAVFRYDLSTRAYDPTKEDRVVASLIAQMQAVQDLRPR